MPLAAVAGPIIGAIGGIGGAAISSAENNKASNTQAQASNNAAQLQAQAAQNSLDFQKQQFATNQANQAPFLQAGQKAVGQLSNFAPFQAPTNVTEQNDPGYQFRLAQGQKAMENSAAGKGNLAGGAALKAAQQYGQDYSSGEYNNVYNRAMGQYNNQLGQLQSLAGVGQSAGQSLGTAGTAAAQQANNTLMNSATNQGTAGMNAAAATASGYQNNGAIWGNVANSLGNTAGSIYSQLNQPGNVGYGGWNVMTGDPMKLQLPGG